MKIGILSDTHRNKIYLEKVVDWLIKKQRISTLYHLGDDYEDVMDLGDRYIDIVQVPGTYHPKYKDGTLAAKAVESVLGLQILLVHDMHKDLTEDDRLKVDVILHGHTHTHELRVEQGVLYLNPGHLKGPLDKNMAPSFGMLDIQDRSVTATIFGIDFKQIDQLELLRAENGLYKA